jgi:outer membrane immunogenic protein
MKLLTISFTLAALTAAPGFAGGPTVIADDPAPAAAPTTVAVHDWSGAYVGLSYGTTKGEVQFTPGSGGALGDGSVAGLHAGYLFQRGSLVYGGELAYGDVTDANYDIFDGIDKTLDLKARLGFASNRALFYGVIGYSQANLYVDGGEWKMAGASFGLGAEFAVSERLTLGLEYLSRDVSGDETSGFPVDADTKFDSVSLRISYTF